MSVSPPPNLRMRAAKGGTFAAIGLMLAGCGASVDMASASANGAQRATMTVPYTNVREEVRLYPDYGPIGAGWVEVDVPAGTHSVALQTGS